MPKVHNVESARTDIWKNGRRVHADNKKGYKIDHSQAGENDTLICNQGESYYWWKFNNDPHKYTSKTYPKQSQLTKSAFLQTIYSITEDFEALDECSSYADLQEWINDKRSELEELRDETEGNLNNMPDQLQESFSGEMLQERIDALDEMINQLDAIDIPDDPEEGDDEADEEMIETLTTIIDEINGISYEGP